jgi:hypothetical protein
MRREDLASIGFFCWVILMIIKTGAGLLVLATFLFAQGINRIAKRQIIMRGRTGPGIELIGKNAIFAGVGWILLGGIAAFWGVRRLWPALFQIASQGMR